MASYLSRFFKLVANAETAYGLSLVPLVHFQIARFVVIYTSLSQARSVTTVPLSVELYSDPILMGIDCSFTTEPSITHNLVRNATNYLPILELTQAKLWMNLMFVLGSVTLVDNSIQSCFLLLIWPGMGQKMVLYGSYIVFCWGLVCSRDCGEPSFERMRYALWRCWTHCTASSRESMASRVQWSPQTMICIV